jgi:protein tyrosine/serine phosphatase
VGDYIAERKRDYRMLARQDVWVDAKAADRKIRSRPVAWLFRGLKIAGVSVGLMAASIGGYWGILQYEGNFHTVSAGILYRSAQPGKTELKAAVAEYGIKSVLNLRGANAGSPWYDEEIAASGELGLAHFDYPLSAKRFVTSKQIAEILDIVRQAPKPLLIHCKAGADRAGLVAALYRFAEAGASAAEADRELSLVYGHFPYLTSRSGAMDDSFWAFVRAAPRAAAR